MYINIEESCTTFCISPEYEGFTGFHAWVRGGQWAGYVLRTAGGDRNEKAGKAVAQPPLRLRLPLPQ